MQFTPIEYSHRNQPVSKEELKTKKKELKCLTTLQAILTKPKLSETKLHDCQMAAGKTSDAFKEKFSKIMTDVRIPKKVETVKLQIKSEINSIKRDIRAFEKEPVSVRSQGKKREREVEEEAPDNGLGPEPMQVADEERTEPRRIIRASRTRPMLEFGLTVSAFAARNFSDLLAQPDLPHATGKLLRVAAEAAVTYVAAKTAITAVGSMWNAVFKATEETEAKKRRKEPDDVAKK